MRIHVVAAAGAGALTLTAMCFALATCKAAPGPAKGAPQGSACGTDLDCDDGLVCSCGRCDPPGAENQPPSCNALATGCPKAIPTACVDSCTAAHFLGNADCGEGGVESCATGVLADTCAPDAGTACTPDGGDVPAGFQCVDGVLVCIQPGAVAGHCLTGDCDGQTPFLCVTACDDPSPVLAECVDHALGCDVAGGFPASDCDGGVADAGTDAGPVDGGPCADQARPLCLFGCDPGNAIDAAQCRSADGGSFDWSCAGFSGYVPADQCDGPDAGQADAGPADAGPDDAGPDGGPDAGPDAG